MKAVMACLLLAALLALAGCEATYESDSTTVTYSTDSGASFETRRGDVEISSPPAE